MIPTTPTSPTATQQRRIAAIRDELMEHCSRTSSRQQEIKREVLDAGRFGICSYSLEIGAVGDEDRLSRHYCRERIAVILGPRGGIRKAISFTGPLYLRSCNGSLQDLGPKR